MNRMPWDDLKETLQDTMMAPTPEMVFSSTFSSQLIRCNIVRANVCFYQCSSCQLSPLRLPPGTCFWNFLNFDASFSISMCSKDFAPILSIPLYPLDPIEHTEGADQSTAGEKTSDYGMNPLWWDNDPRPHYMGSRGLGILHSVAWGYPIPLQ